MAEEVESRQDEQREFQSMDVFGLEYASDPRISPDGTRVVYVRNFMDVMKDVTRSSLWIVNFNGLRHRALSGGNETESQPRWSPDGTRLAYVSDSSGSTQLYLRWMDTGQTTRLTQLTHSLSSLAWSPDGRVQGKIIEGKIMKLPALANLRVAANHFAR